MVRISGNIFWSDILPLYKPFALQCLVDNMLYLKMGLPLWMGKKRAWVAQQGGGQIRLIATILMDYTHIHTQTETLNLLWMLGCR